MLKEILQEILEMEYPKERIIKGLANENNRHISFAAAYGYGMALGDIRTAEKEALQQVFEELK